MRPHLTSKSFRGIKTNRMKLAQKGPAYSFLLISLNERNNKYILLFGTSASKLVTEKKIITEEGYKQMVRSIIPKILKLKVLLIVTAAI